MSGRGNYQCSPSVAQLAFAIALFICAKLIDWRNRWTPS